MMRNLYQPPEPTAPVAWRAVAQASRKDFLRFRTYFIALLAFGCSISAGFAQNVDVAGTVTDQTDNTGLPGVNVTVKGTTSGTVTDAEGKYAISVPGDATLVFSFIGYATQEILVNNQTTINVPLAGDVQALDEVVVIGYGTQQKRDVTGSISNVKGEELTRQPVQTPTQALQGKTPGVQVIASGAPNSQPQVRIRGTGSVLAGVNPLYVVDGVLTDDIRNINNNDIVSIDVLKDASAAIYGVRAANGVIIITTKKGKAGELRVNYDANVGFRQAARIVDMADRNQYETYINDLNAYQADIQPGTPPIQVDRLGLTYPGTTSWYDEILRNALQMNHNLSVSGGSEKHTFFFSGNYFVDNGIIETNDFERITFRANNDVKISDRVQFSSQLSFSRGQGRGVDFGSAFNSAYRAAPVIQPELDGRYGNTSAFGNVANPVLDLDKNNIRDVSNRLQGNVSLEYKPVKVLRLRSAFNTDINFLRNRTYGYQYFNDDETFLAAGGNQQGLNSQLSVTQTQTFRWIWDNTATWEQTFGVHNLTFLIGSVTERFDSDVLGGSRINVPEDEDQWYLDLGNPDEQATQNNGGDRFTRQSFVGRINYSFGGKYLLNASFRADGSSRFSERWGYFPTVGAGWIISDEGFMQGNKIFSLLKLRSSYGILGNDNIPSNQYITTADINIPYFFGNNLVLGSAIQQIKDEDLKWERTEQFDIGLEFGFLNNRLTGEVDFYNKNVQDALATIPIPGILGSSSATVITNLGSFRNRGFEFALNWQDEIGENFSYNVGINGTFNQNKILGLNQGQPIISGVTRTDNGQPVGSFYVLRAVGVFQSDDEIASSPVFGSRDATRPGDLKYADVSGPNGVPDSLITEEDRVFAGSYQPPFYYGFNFGIRYRNFDLAADFYGNVGNEIYNGKKIARNQLTDNVEADFANDRWTPSNPTNSDPARILSNTQPSTYFVESGDFLRLNNLTLGYTIPKAVLERAKITNLRIFVTSQNLFALQKFSGFTPELPGDGPLTAGNEQGAYPTTRTFAAGINVGF